MTRSQCGLRGLAASSFAAIAMFVAALPISSATDDGFSQATTLAPRVAPQYAELDATIASMIRRKLIADVHAPKSAAGEASPPAEPDGVDSEIAAAPKVADLRTKWRAAGRSSSAAADGSAARPLSSQIVPEPTVVPTPEDDEVESVPPSSSADASTAQGPLLLIQPETGGAVSPSDNAAEDAAGDDDHLAPIDELPETPAPESDAPGDPIEPEMTGAALENALLPPAKPLSQAPKNPAAGNVALGEPDRLARPSKRSRPPADPKQYQQPEPPTATTTRLPPLSRNQRLLRDKIRRVLKYYYDRPLSAADRSPWEVMHATLAYEVHSRILQGGRGSKPVTAVGWLCFNQPCRDRTLLYLNEDGDLRVKVGPALQGHHGQLLAILAQARVRSDYPIKVDGREFTVADLIEVEKATCYPKTELTFKLIGLQRYLDINAKWVNDQGMTWDFPTLVSEELRQPVKSAACGGTHRLAGLALAVKKQRNSGLPVDGIYAQAEQYVANYVNYAYRLQNNDGSFSTAWFNGPGAEADVDRRLKTTGHILEFIIYASAEEQLDNFRIVRAVNYLTNIMYANRSREWEAGPLGHAIHALVLYDRLVFAKYDQASPAAGPVASQPRRASR